MSFLHAPGSSSVAEVLRREEVPVEDVVDERAFAGAGHAGDAGENAQRKIDVELLQVVLASRLSTGDERARLAALRRDRDGLCGR